MVGRHGRDSTQNHDMNWCGHGASFREALWQVPGGCISSPRGRSTGVPSATIVGASRRGSKRRNGRYSLGGWRLPHQRFYAAGKHNHVGIASSPDC